MNFDFMQLLTNLPGWLMPIVYVIWQIVKYKLLNKKEKNMNEEKLNEETLNEETSSCCPSAGQSDCCQNVGSPYPPDVKDRYMIHLLSIEHHLLANYMTHTDCDSPGLSARREEISRTLDRLIFGKGDKDE